jgi:hypothetical protein
MIKMEQKKIDSIVTNEKINNIKKQIKDIKDIQEELVRQLNEA